MTDKASFPLKLGKWLRRQDAVVLHGHSDPRMLFAGPRYAARCAYLIYCAGNLMPKPQLLDGVSSRGTHLPGSVSAARPVHCQFGQLNAAFYDRYKKIPHFEAPYSVDNARFRSLSTAARANRHERLTSLGLHPCRPTVIFSGKLAQKKRPLDAVRAIERCAGQLNLVLVGDGPLRDEVRHFEARLPVRCTGFVNQADLPHWYASGDVLVLPSESEPWRPW